MKAHLRRRPQLETLESINLLSAAALPGLSAMVAPMTGQAIHLTGTARGTYHAHIANPDTGTTFTFAGQPSQIKPLGMTVVTGTIQSPGFILHGQSHGTLLLKTAHGSLTLSVTGPPQNSSTPLPDVFSFKITKATGQLRGDTGTGFIDLGLIPNPTPTAMSGMMVTGHFSMQFLTVPPPIPFA